MNQQNQIQFGNFSVIHPLTATEVDYPNSDEHLTETLRSFKFTDIVITLARINLFLQRSANLDYLSACEMDLQRIFCSTILRNEIERRGLTTSHIFLRVSTLRLLSKSVCVIADVTATDGAMTMEAMNNLARCYLIANEQTDVQRIDFGTEQNDEQKKDSLAEMIADCEYVVAENPWHHIRNKMVRSRFFITHLREISPELEETFSRATEPTRLTLQEYQHLIFSVFAVYSRFSPQDILKGALFVVPPRSADFVTSYDKLLEYDGIPIDELARKAEMICSMPEEFRLWRMYPLVKLRENQFMCIDIGFLLDKLETGVFWIIRNQLEKDCAGKGEEIIGLRGEIFECYTASIIERGINAQTSSSMERCIVRPKYAQQPQAECTDIAVCGRETLILLECKAPLLSAKTKFSRDFSEFYKGAKRKIIEPNGIEQLWKAVQSLGHADCNERRKVDGIDISKVKKIYSVLVLPDRMFSVPWMNWFLNKEFQRFVNHNKLTKHLEVLPLTVVTIEDLENLEPYLSDVPFHIHLDRWITQFFENNQPFPIQFIPFSEYLRSLMEGDARENIHLVQECERIVADMGKYFSSCDFDL